MRMTCAYRSSCFIPSAPLPTTTTSISKPATCSFTQCVARLPCATLPARRCVVTASFTDDFFRGPSSPPKPRPLYQVALFSITTNLLWYGYYKFCIEEELRRETGIGLGGFLVLSPFVAGISSPLFVHDTNIAIALAAGGLGWILLMQYWLLERVNKLYIETFGGDGVLTTWWAFVPPFNVICGLRVIHFLSVIWGGTKDEDPLVNLFPFLGVEKLGMGQLLTTPSLWVSLKQSDNSTDDTGKKS